MQDRHIALSVQCSRARVAIQRLCAEAWAYRCALHACALHGVRYVAALVCAVVVLPQAVLRRLALRDCVRAALAPMEELGQLDLDFAALASMVQDGGAPEAAGRPAPKASGWKQRGAPLL